MHPGDSAHFRDCWTGHLTSAEEHPMAHPTIATGLYVPPQPPLGSVRQFIFLARLLRLDPVMVWDHLQDFTPQAIWDDEYSWFALQRPSPHAYFDYQVLLGHLASRVGGRRLGVGVTEA